MAGNIPMGSMSTEIKLNGSQSVKTLKELKQAVTQATSAWKAQRAELSTIGKSTEAAEAKYKGLAETIKKQKDYISGLQEAQKHLQEAQKSVDRSTKEGQQEYGKYNEALQKNETRIHSAQQKLAGLADQQSKAKKSLDYYKSGLAEAQKQLRLNESVTKSYVARLSSEGKSYEAAKAKLSGYRNSIESLTKQQKIQAQELSRIASESGKSSDAYKRQQVRVNETAASLAKAKTQMTELDNSMRKANPSFLDRIRSKLTGVNKKADQTHKTFKEVFAGSFLGNALSNAVSNVAGQLKTTVTEGMNLNAAIAKINARFKSMGMSDRYIKILDNQIGELKAQTNMTGDNVANLQTRMLNWSNIGTKGAMQMTKMIAGVGDSSKLSGDQIEQMGASLMRVGSTGKVTYSALNRVTKSAPTFMAQLAKGAGMSEDKLKSLLKSGKVTQTQFQEWMAAASKYSDTAFKGFSSTQGGALKFMQVRWQKLEQTMTKPLFDAKTSGLQALKDIMASPELLKGATAIGNALSSTLGYIDKHKKDIAGITSDITHIAVQLGKDVWKDVSGIIGDIGKSFGLIHGNTKKTEDPLHMVKLTMDGLAKNKTAIQWISKAIVAMVAVKGLKAVTSPLVGLANIKIGDKSLIGMLAKGGFKFGKGMLHPIKNITNTWDKFLIHLSNGKTRVGKITDAFKTGFSKIGKFGQSSWKVISKAWGKASDLGSKAGKGIVKGFKATGHGLASAGKWSWSKIKSGFGTARSFGQTLGKQLVAGFKASVKIGKGLFTQKGGAGIFNGALQSAKSAGGFKNLTTAGKVGTAAAGAGVAVDAATSIVKGIKDKVGSRKQYEDIGTGAGKAIGGGIGLYFGGPLGAAVGAKIGGVVGKWGGDAVKSFQNGWSKKKPPKNFWSLENLGYSAHNMWKGFTKGVSNTIKWFKKNWKEVGLYFISPLAGAINSLYKHNKGFHKWVNGLVKGFKDAWNGIGKWFGNIGKNIQKSWKGMTKWFKNLGKNMANGLKSAWKSMTKWFSNIGNGIKKAWRSMTSWFAKLGKGMSNGLKATWHGVVKFFSDIGKNVKHAWNSMTSFFSKLGKNTADFFKRPWKTITGWFKSIISGIKSAWDGFWDHISGPIKTLQKLFTGKLKVGSLHLANGTDWRSKYGTPAIVNDAPGDNYREGLITNGQIIPFPDKRNLPFWLRPDQDIINGNDMAKMFGHAVHHADGTVNLRSLETKDPTKLLSTLTNLAKKKYSEDRLRHEKQKQRHDKNDQDRTNERKRLIKKEADAKSERAKIAKEIREALKKGKNAKGLTSQFNKLTNHIADIKHSIAKTNPHHGQTLVDEGLLIGAKSRIGKSKWISTALFNKLIDKLDSKKKRTSKRTTSSRRRTTHRRSASTRKRTVTRVSTPRISGKSITIRATVKGLNNVTSLSRAISAIHSKSVKISASGSSVKGINALAKAIKRIKGGTHKITVKTSGEKGLKALYKYTRRIKGKTRKVRIKTSGVSGLKSLQRNITSVNKRVKSLDHEAKKSRFGKDIAKQAEEAVKSLKGKGNFAKQFASMVKKFDKELKGMVKSSKKEFNSMWSSIKKTSSTGQTGVIHELSSFSSHYKSGWRSFESGVYKSFSHFWTNMKSAAGRGVNGVLRIVNSAIGKIDSVISDFGGSKTAVKQVGLVHYASGTGVSGSSIRRAITKPTFAVLNDGNDSPETGNRETIWNKATNTFGVVQGRNVPLLLGPQHEVFNATESKLLGFTHYASGTGVLHKLYEIAKHNWNHPVKTGQSMFSAVNGLTGAMKELASGMRSKSEDQGVTWWSQLWKMVEDKVDDDDLGPASGLLKEVETLGKNKHYSQGKRMSKFFADCSSLVSRALSKKYGASWATPNGWALTVAGLWDHAHRISKSEAKPGDPVFWLPDTHVGVYAGHGMYYSAYGPGDGGPVGMQRIAPGATFGRFNGLNTEGSKSDNPKVKANTTLQKKIKAQVGQGFWKTIQKIADKYGDNGLAGAFKLGGDVAQRAKALAKAIKQAVPGATKNGLAAIIGSWEFESGGLNPAAINPNGGASGLGQWLYGRLTNLKAYARKHGKSWKDPATQINFAANAEGSDSAIFRRIAKGSGSPASLANAFSREWERGGYDAQHAAAAVQIARALRGYANGGITSAPSIFGEAGPEMAIPLIPSKSTRAWELIGKAIAILSANTTFGQQQNQIDSKEQKEEHEFRQAVILLLQQLVAKDSNVDVKLTTPAGRALWEVVEPYSKQEQRAEQIRERRGLSGRFV